jgi:adenosylhomocysteine nucleosidase
MPARLGLVVALDREAACVGGRALPRDTVTKLDDHCLAFVCGTGPRRAGNAARALLAAGASHLLSVGTAAALREGLAPGDLVVPAAVTDGQESHNVDETWRLSLVRQLSAAPGALDGGLLLSVEHVAATPEEKAALGRDTGAVAVDMESSAVLAAGAEAGVPCAAVRVIVDPPGLAVPALVLAHCDEYGRPRLLALLAALLGDVRQFIPFLRLAQAFAASTRTLRWLGGRRQGLLPAACIAGSTDL